MVRQCQYTSVSQVSYDKFAEGTGEYVDLQSEVHISTCRA